MKLPLTMHELLIARQYLHVAVPGSTSWLLCNFTSKVWVSGVFNEGVTFYFLWIE